MKTKLLLGAALTLLLSSPGCDSTTTKTYPVTFVCSPTGGTACPPGNQCPELPLSADSCGDLPGLFGHPPTPMTTGRPVGCTVGLSYGNPYFSDTQQDCTCTAPISSSASAAAQWECPI